jgi:hypothetical protein
MNTRFAASLYTLCALTLLASGCAGTAAPPAASGAMPASRADSAGNIYWNKQEVRLKYPSSSLGRAVLTYWGPNGYYPAGPTCRHGGQVQTATGRQWGNPSGYMHIAYTFKALSQGPDLCGFDAILLGTGSPPIAVLQLRILR